MAKQKPWVGSKVRIVNPEIVVRVGYPKSLHDYFQLALEQYGQRLTGALPELLGSSEWQQMLGADPHVRTKAHPLLSKLLWAIAFPLARKDRFGGNLRSIHTRSAPELKGREFEVLERRSAYTGSRYAGHPRSSCWDDDGEPPSLEDVQHHNMLMLSVSFPDGDLVAMGASSNPYANGIWIAAEHVERI